MVTLIAPRDYLQGEVQIPSSKSISNRVLIIDAIAKFGNDLQIENCSNSSDTLILERCLVEISKGVSNLNVGDAGTTFRFLTAYLAHLEGEWVIAGSERLNKRPIEPLVNALRQVGARIEYLEAEGFAPLQIFGKKLKGGHVYLPGHISSQFISGLLMTGVLFEDGLEIHFTSEVTSLPYVSLTVAIMNQFGVEVTWCQRSFDTRPSLCVNPQQSFKLPQSKKFIISGDWSAASYWYSFVALSKRADLVLKGLSFDQLQGDSILMHLATLMGVKSEVIGPNAIRLSKTLYKPIEWGYNFSDCPDLFQTFAVISAALGLGFIATGLHTLPLKETNRLDAMVTELTKLGCACKVINQERFELAPLKLQKDLRPIISTYKDHRMAMAFAPLSLVLPEIYLENPAVVEKSYPAFWNDLSALRFSVL